MGYIWNPVKEDILRLKSLFYSLSKTFKEQKIDDELRKKSEELLETLAMMVDNFEKRYKVDDEEKQGEGGALDDEEKQHERSVLELQKHERIVIELWLEELQEALFNTEDLVAKIHTEALRHKLDGQVSEKMEDIHRCIESYVKAGHVLGLAGQMSYGRYLQQIYELMEKYEHNDSKEKQRQRGPIEQPLESQRQPLDPIDSIYFLDESEVFGMYCDKEEIINLLLSDDANDKQLSVISIVGNGVSRKTTLARLVYDEQRVSHHFDRKAWVDVPYNFNWETESILKFVLPQYMYKYRSSDYRKGKRFLLVLDGAKPIPSSEGWEALQSAFNLVANGGRIVVTTQNKDIASMKYPVRTYRMEPLSEEKCWPIFAKFAFGDQNPTSDTQLEVIGKEIVQMCHGLPSSVRILGSLLRFKPQQEWEAILKRLKPSSDSRENVKVVHNLRPPEDLKRCLAYCSMFPQDYEIEKEKLVLLWMAEGFLKLTPEAGRWAISRFINELKPFFQKSSRSESSFRMCTNNLAAYVSSRYCFRLEDNHPSQIPLNTRYLSLVGGKYENSVIFEAIDRAKLLRTFLPLDHESRHLCATELQNLLSKLQFLRVLSLSHYHITEIPDSIGNLEHLRYIDLSHTPIKRLPESVCELCNLQSLILSNCHSLTELPKNTLNLKNLLNLDISGSGLSEMPIGISKLRNLQLLPCFVVGKKSGSALTELQNIINLQGTLHISKLQNVTCEDGVDKDNRYFRNFHYLEEVVLEWDDNTADPENATKVLAGLKPLTHSTLERLTINFYCGTKFPEWFGDERLMSKIVFLHLSNCKNCSTLPSLGQLPKLRVLIIECMDAVEEVGPDFSAETSTTMYTEFKSLERLTFEGMSKWTKWVPLNVLPCLQQLCIRRCPKLRGNLPNELPLVERVEISESQELVTALTTEESLKTLHYSDRIVSISSDGKETYFKSERARGSSSLIIEGEVTEKLEETQKSRETKEETNVEIQSTSQTKWSKQEQKESIEDPSQFPILEEESSLPLSQFPILEEESSEEESSLPLTQSPSLPLTQSPKILEEESSEEESSEEEYSSLPLTQSPKILEKESSEEEYSSLPLTQSPKILEEESSEEESSLPLSQFPILEEESSLPLSQRAAECLLPVAPGEVTEKLEETQKSRETKEETNVEIQTTSQTKWSKQEQKESIEDPSQFPILEEESSLLLSQRAAECSLPVALVTGRLKETEEKGETKEETTSQTKWSKHEQKESIEDPSQFPFLEVESTVPPPQRAAECSLLATPGTDLSFKSMKVSGILQLIELPEGLHSLKIEGCDALEEIPEGIMASLNQLQHLYIINCCSLNSLPEDHPPTALKKLYVQNCKKLEISSLTKRTHQYAFLEHLCIGSSDSLISLPLNFFPKLRSLSIWDCANLESLSMTVEIQKDLSSLEALEIRDLSSLEALEIRDCPKLESVLKGGLSASNLMSIWLSNCKNLKELPDRLNTLMNSLRSLFINNCPEVVSLPKLPSSLSLLSITFCYKLELVMDWGLHSLCNLSRLEIEGGCKNVETFPEDKLLPNNLNSLCISALLNLKYLNCKGLQHLTALKTLEISCCNKLQPFPEEDLPSSLSLLCIKECSLLKPKLLNKRKMFD